MPPAQDRMLDCRMQSIPVLPGDRWAGVYWEALITPQNHLELLILTWHPSPGGPAECHWTSPVLPLDPVILNQENLDLYPTKKQETAVRPRTGLFTSLVNTGRSGSFKSIPVLVWQTPLCLLSLQLYAKQLHALAPVVTWVKSIFLTSCPGVLPPSLSCLCTVHPTIKDYGDQGHSLWSQIPLSDPELCHFSHDVCALHLRWRKDERSLGVLWE